MDSVRLYKIALLVDAENISYKDLPYLKNVLPHYGKIVLTAVYGNWDNPAMQNWHDFAKQRRFKIRHCTHNASGKNAADMRLFGDAMRILYEPSIDIDIICLASNDADYVILCEQVREANKAIIGVGHTHAAKAFVDACNHFIFIDNQEDPVAELVRSLLEDTPDDIRQQSRITPAPVVAAPVLQPPPTQAEIVAHKKTLIKAFRVTQPDKQGYITSQQLGMAISSVYPGFRQQYYPRQTLSQFLEHFTDIIDVDTSSGIVKMRLKNSPPHSSQNLHNLVGSAFLSIPYVNDGWKTLSALGTALHQCDDMFDPKHYGHNTLTALLLSMPEFVEVQSKNGTGYARLLITDETKELIFRDILEDIFNSLTINDDWILLSTLGTAIREIQPNFDPRYYGHSGLTKLLEHMPDFIELRTKYGAKSARLKK